PTQRPARVRSHASLWCAGAHRDLHSFPTRRSSDLATHAMEIRFVEGRFREAGASTAWFRLRVPLIAGTSTFPLDRAAAAGDQRRSEEHTSELQSLAYLVCRLLLEKKKQITTTQHST